VTEKPILVTWLAATSDIKTWFYNKKIPLFEDSDRCIFGASLLSRYTTLKRTLIEMADGSALETHDEKLRALYKGKSGFLNEWDSKCMVSAAGIKTDAPRVAKDLNELRAIADKIEYPVAVKVLSKTILHKSDIGGVVLNIKDADALTMAFETIVQNVKTHDLSDAFEGVIVSAMQPKGTEMIVGIKKDPLMGTAVVLGMGGTMVEILNDAVMQLIPINKKTALRMIDSLKSKKMLYGYRDIVRKDIDALADVIVSVSKLCMMRPDISEMDMNPVFVYDEGKGATVIDALIKLEG